MNLFQVAAQVYKNRERIARTWELAKPLVDYFAKDGADLFKNIHQLEENFGITVPPSKDGTIPARYDVEWIQRSLNKDLGIDLDIDGKYGPATKNAVEKFQRKHGLDVDGWVGPLTAEAMEALK